jgi:adenine C2-methylase RlmN of 23S rRNA A2503 and tRNA A37
VGQIAMMRPQTSSAEGAKDSLYGLKAIAPTLTQLLTSENTYRSRNWDRERATRYVFSFGPAIVEASFFCHYNGGHLVKQVVELPTSFGCPVACRHCASALLPAVNQLNTGQIVGMFDAIVAEQSMHHDEPFLVTFSGIGEGAFQGPNLDTVCRAIHRVFPCSYFTLTTVGFDVQFLAMVDELATKIPVHYLQITYLHYDTKVLKRVVPTAELLKFNFPLLIAAITAMANARVRLNYVVIRDFNDNVGHAAVVAKMLDRLQSKVTLRISSLNETGASAVHSLNPASIGAMEDIVRHFKACGFEAYIFQAYENDDMNCGQLAGNYVTKRRSGSR